MSEQNKDGQTERILICAPFGRDSDLIRRELQGAGFTTVEYQSLEELCAHLDEGAGAALIGDQAFAQPGSVGCLAEALAGQPPWSDVPVLVITSGGASTANSREAFRRLQSLGRVTLLERPLRPATLFSSLQSAIRSRRQQYQIRDYVKSIEESQKALRESEGRLRFFIEHAPVAITMFDREMRYLAASRRWMELDGITGDVSGRCPYEVFPQMTEAWKEAHRRGLAGEVVSSRSDRFELPDGTVTWLKREIMPWYTEAGEIGGIFVATEDVTSRVRMEQHLRESEKQFRTLANAIPDSRMDGGSLWLGLLVQPALVPIHGHNPEKRGGLGLGECAGSRGSAA